MKTLKSLMLWFRVALVAYMLLHLPVIMPYFGLQPFSIISLLILLTCVLLWYFWSQYERSVRHTLFHIGFKFRQHWYFEAEKRKQAAELKAKKESRK